MGLRPQSLMWEELEKVSGQRFETIKKDCKEEARKIPRRGWERGFAVNTLRRKEAGVISKQNPLHMSKAVELGGDAGRGPRVGKRRER